VQLTDWEIVGTLNSKSSHLLIDLISSTHQQTPISVNYVPYAHSCEDNEL